MCIRLQQGLNRLCFEKANGDEEFLRSINNKGPLEFIDEYTFKLYRDHRLRKTIHHAYENSPYYKKSFDSCGISPGDVQTIEDLHKLPFTTPEDISKNSYGFLCTSQGLLEKQVTFYSSGTTGLKKKVFFSASDVEEILRFLSTGMRTVTDAESKIYIMLPNTQGRGIGNLLSGALLAAGMHPEVGDLEWSSERHLEAIKKHQPEVIFGNARSIFRLTQEMRSKNDLSALNVKTLFMTMEHVSESARQWMERWWGCPIRMHYGLAEMGWGLAVECSGKKYHYNQLGVIAEVIDPVTGATLPSGYEGELVFTTLNREAMPLLRYRSHDFASIYNGKCGCGQSIDGIGYVKKRSESVIMTPDGYEITPALLDEWVFRSGSVIDYQVEYHEGSIDGSLSFKIEMAGANSEDVRKTEEHIRQLCTGHLKMGHPKIDYVEPGSLFNTATEKKMVRWVVNGVDKHLREISNGAEVKEDQQQRRGIFEMKLSGGKRAIIVLSEIYGVNEFIVDQCQRFRDAGYKVFCPNIIGKPPFPYDASAEAYDFFMNNIGFDRYEEINSLVCQLKKEYEKVFVIGFSVGATISWRCCENHLCDGIVACYGSRIRDYTDLKPVCPMLLILAKEDSYDVQALALGLRNKQQVSVLEFEAGHGFLDPYSECYSERQSKCAEEAIDSFLIGIKG